MTAVLCTWCINESKKVLEEFYLCFPQVVIILVLFFPGLLDLKDKKYIHEIVVCGFIYGLITSTHHVALLATPMPDLIGALLPAIGCAIGSELVVACFLPVILRPSIIVVLGGHLLEE